MTLFYHAFIESVLPFFFPGQGLESCPWKKETHWIRSSNGPVSRCGSHSWVQSRCTLLYIRQLQRLASSISNDHSRTLFGEFQHLPSFQRFKGSRTETKHYRNSFVPAATALFNKSWDFSCTFHWGLLFCWKSNLVCHFLLPLLLPAQTNGLLIDAKIYSCMAGEIRSWIDTLSLNRPTEEIEATE